MSARANRARGCHQPRTSVAQSSRGKCQCSVRSSRIVYLPEERSAAQSAGTAGPLESIGGLCHTATVGLPSAVCCTAGQRDRVGRLRYRRTAFGAVSSTLRGSRSARRVLGQPIRSHFGDLGQRRERLAHNIRH